MTRIALRTLWLAMLFVVVGLFPDAAVAQSASLSVGSGSALPGEQVSVPVTISGTDPLQGVSFGIRHEPLDVSLVSAVLGFGAAQLNGGIGPDFVLIDPSSSSAAEVGLTFGLVVDFADLETLPLVVPQELANLTYELRAATALPTLLEFTGNLEVSTGSPPIAISASLDIGGLPVEVIPTTNVGTLTPLTVDLILPDELSIPIGFETEVPVRYRGPDPVDAFGFGVAHDPAVLSVTDVVFAPDLAPLFTSSLFFSEIVADGFSVGWIGDPLFIESIPPVPVTPIEIIRVTYSALPGAPVSTPLTFSATVAAMVVPEVFVNGGDFRDPVLFDGSLRPITALPFVRGDANGDGSLTVSDAVFSLEYIFLDANPTCIVSLDFDDSSQVTISDAFGLLSYLFLAAAPPVSPFPDCGFDLDAGTLECASTPSNCVP